MARTEFVTPVGRLVQGGITLEDQKNDDGTPKRDDQGNPVKQCFLAVAFAKNDPQFGAFYALMVATAKAEFPHLFPNGQDQCTHPQFSWKLQDGDGVDHNGKSVADKPGFAGHWIVKMASQFLPKCYYEGKFDPAQQIPNPAEVIKRGYYVRVCGTIAGNGVTANDRTKKPGLFISANLVSFVSPGTEIVGGPDAAKAFGSVPLGALPPGATPMPQVAGAASAAGLTPPPLPNAAPAPVAAPAAALPALPAAPAVAAPAVAAPAVAAPAVAAPALPAAPGVAPLPPMPGAANAPSFQMTASAQGATREQLHALGWTDDQLIAQGHMIRVG